MTYRYPNTQGYRTSTASPPGRPVGGTIANRRSFVGPISGNNVIGTQGTFRTSITNGVPANFGPPQGSHIPGFRRSVVGPSNIVGPAVVLGGTGYNSPPVGSGLPLPPPYTQPISSVPIRNTTTTITQSQ